MDFNIFHPSEPSYKNVPIVINPLSLFKHELLFILEGKNTDVLGDYENWIDIESLVFKSNINEAEINSNLRNAIESKSEYASMFTWDSNVYFLDTNGSHEVGVIEINIYDIDTGSELIDTLKFVYTG